MSGPQNELKSHEGNPVPIKGETVGECNLLSLNGAPFVFKRFTGNGDVSHMGNVQAVFDYAYLTFDLNPAHPYHGLVGYFPAGHPLQAKGYMVAANGDKLFFEMNLVTNPLPGIPAVPYVSLFTFGDFVTCTTPGAPPLMPTTATLWSSNGIFTGGTGRFEGATGELQVWGEQWGITVPDTWPPSPAFYAIPVPTKFTFEGTIDY